MFFDIVLVSIFCSAVFYARIFIIKIMTEESNS